MIHMTYEHAAGVLTDEHVAGVLTDEIMTYIHTYTFKKTSFQNHHKSILSKIINSFESAFSAHFHGQPLAGLKF